MDKLDGFNLVAPVYDALGRIVFGNALAESQTCFTHLVNAGARVLVVGGGTGKAVKALMSANANCEVRYVEAASAMINRARLNLKPFQERVTFIHGTHESIPPDELYDVVITYFFLDLFPEERCRQVAVKLAASLKDDGIWLAADFTSGIRPLHRFLLRTMYAFFRVASGIEARRLPQWENAIVRAGLRMERHADFYNGFIRSAVFRKESGRHH